MRPPQLRSVDPADAVIAAQVVALAGLLWPGRGRWRLPRPVRRAALLTAAGAGTLSLTGARQLGDGLTMRVEPPPGAQLRTTGVYALSRHPIYAGLLASSGAVALLRRRPEPLAAAALLSMVLHLKSRLEEDRLRARFGAEYDDYTRRVPRLVGRPGPGALPRLLGLRPGVRRATWPRPEDPAGSRLRAMP